MTRRLSLGGLNNLLSSGILRMMRTVRMQMKPNGCVCVDLALDIRNAIFLDKLLFAIKLEITGNAV